MKQTINKPIISEKTYRLASLNKFTFSAAKSATKDEIKALVEKLYGVSVLSVNISCVAGKIKRSKTGLGSRDSYKRVVVTLKKGQSISLFDIEKEETAKEKKTKEKKAESKEKTAEVKENKDVEVKITKKGK